jgi:hypothetical protein
MVTEISGITANGIHFVVEGRGRFLLTNNGQLVAYGEVNSYRPFALVGLRGADMDLPTGIAPWCNPNDYVTIISGSIRSCTDLGKEWRGELVDAMGGYVSISGRYGIHKSDRHIHKLSWSPGNTFHTEQLILIPQILKGVVSIAKNDQLIAVLTPTGLIGIWTTHHLEIPSRGIRQLPLRQIHWISIHPTGGNSFVVFGEFFATGMRDAWFIPDILELDKYKR